MRKAEVTLRDGFRYYRLDNHFHDVKFGDEIDLDDLTPRDAAARIQAGHVKVIAKTKADLKAEKAAADADAQTEADLKAEADAKTKGKK